MEHSECSCEQCQLRTIFFSHIVETQLNNICSLKRETTFEIGDSITKENTPIREFMYIKKGLVKLSKTAPDGKDQIISFAKPFDFVSLLSIFSESKYQYSVTAIQRTTVCKLDLRIIKEFACKNALFAMDLITAVSKASDSIILENLTIRRKNLKGRVAHLLLYFSTHIFRSNTFILPISRREIAEYIGMTTENVIRTLSEFKKDNIIKSEGKEITITNMKRLQSVSEFG